MSGPADGPVWELDDSGPADLQLAAGLCFFTAAWETCGMAGVPGFAVYPGLAQKLANESFLVGQALAVQIFSALGLLLLLAAMRAERPWARG